MGALPVPEKFMISRTSRGRRSAGQEVSRQHFQDVARFGAAKSNAAWSSSASAPRLRERCCDRNDAMALRNARARAGQRAGGGATQRAAPRASGCACLRALRAARAKRPGCCGAARIALQPHPMYSPDLVRKLMRSRRRQGSLCVLCVGDAVFLCMSCVPSKRYDGRGLPLHDDCAVKTKTHTSGSGCK